MPSTAKLLLCLIMVAGAARAQQTPVAADSTATPPHDHTAMMHDHAGMDMGGMPMTGFYGAYPMSREASGTAWQPQAARHEGLHVMRGPWMLMFHGFADLVYDDQGGERGDEKLFSDNMGMAMAQRHLGPGTFGLRAMMSLEPSTIGKDGYPLLLQTGETADGVTPLVDRQHPHDLFMELAGTYSIASADRSLFVYAGLPGEPALGPPAFMHRYSGINLPAAPITHHWLDSTHITYGVLTAGAVVGGVKVEASAFHGREPDENRWDIESGKLDSHSFRLSFNPGTHWAFQASYGRLHSPEQLEPDVDQDRITASAMVEGTWGGDNRWAATIAWGLNHNHPGHTLNAVLAEAALARGETQTFFGRYERAAKDELFAEDDELAGQVFDVGGLTVGYRWDFLRREHTAIGFGATGSISRIPFELHEAYGEAPMSAMVFLRVALR